MFVLLKHINSGQPNDFGDERCVVIDKGEGTWDDRNCGIKQPGFICKKNVGDNEIKPVVSLPIKGFLMLLKYCSCIIKLHVWCYSFVF